jgi:hypothetical protein
MASSWRTVEGVAAARARAAHQAVIASSADGQRNRMSASQSQPVTSWSAKTFRSAAVWAQG